MSTHLVQPVRSIVMPSESVARSADPRRPLALAATIALLVAGLSLTAYALTGFAVRDWTVAGPGLLVAAAGILGLRFRLAYLAGAVPIGAVLSIAGRIVAYDLVRPGETAHFVGSATIVVGACFAAVLGVAAAVAPAQRRALFVALGVSTMACVATVAFVLGGNAASAATDAGISEVERRSAIDVEMNDYSFVVAGAIPDGAVIHLRNTGALPHQFDVPELGVAVFVPSGRDTYLRLPQTDRETIGLICTVGDHQQRGMGLDLELVPLAPRP